MFMSQHVIFYGHRCNRFGCLKPTKVALKLNCYVRIMRLTYKPNAKLVFFQFS